MGKQKSIAIVLGVTGAVCQTIRKTHDKQNSQQHPDDVKYSCRQ
jgi:hypothetical protein